MAEVFSPETDERYPGFEGDQICFIVSLLGAQPVAPLPPSPSQAPITLRANHFGLDGRQLDGQTFELVPPGGSAQ